LREGSGTAIALFGLGHLTARQGDHAAAIALLEECLALQRAERDSWGTAEALCLLGEVVHREGEHDRAAQLYAESLSLNEAIGDRGIFELTLHHLGTIAQGYGRLPRAVRLFAAARGLRRSSQVSIPWALSDPAERERDIVAVRATLGEDRFAAAWAEGRAMTLEQATKYALATSGDAG
jgi:non-specific serine/threonine protein kinase